MREASLYCRELTSHTVQHCDAVHSCWLTAARQTGDVLSVTIFKVFHPPPHSAGTNAGISKYKVDQQYLQPNCSPLQEIQSQHGGKTKCH
jgi:hypothetical protein